VSTDLIARKSHVMYVGIRFSIVFNDVRALLRATLSQAFRRPGVKIAQKCEFDLSNPFFDFWRAFRAPDLLACSFMVFRVQKPQEHR